MVTYSELFQFCLVVIGIVALVFQSKQKYPPHRPNVAVIFVTLLGLTVC